MATKPQSLKSAFTRPQQAYEARVVGGAEILWSEGKVRVTFLPHWKSGIVENKFADGKTVRLYDEKDFPFPIPAEAAKEAVDGNLVVHLDKDGELVEFCTPYEWQGLSAKLVDFSRPNGKDSPPMWVEKDPYKPGDKPTLEFSAIYEFTHNPAFKGKRVRQAHHYMFVDNGNGQAAWDFNVVSATQAYQGVWTQKLMDMTLKTGAVSADWLNVGIATWAEGNILPKLLDNALRANKTVKLSFKNGWIDSIGASNKFSGDDGERTVEEIKKELGVEVEKPVSKTLSNDPDEM